MHFCRPRRGADRGKDRVHMCGLLIRVSKLRAQAWPWEFLEFWKEVWDLAHFGGLVFIPAS